MEKVRLSTVTEIIAGQSPPSTTYNSNGIGLPFYQGKADFGDKHPQPKIWCTEPIKIAQKNDILISVRAPVGTVNINAETSCIGRGLSAIRPLKIYGEYLFYVLKFEEKNIAKLGVGSTFSAITQKDLKEIEIPFPSYADQIRIASVLGKIEDVIQARKNAIDQLDELVKAPFYDMFGDPVRNEKGWDKEEIGNITTIGTGGTPSRTKESEYYNGNIPWIKTTELKNYNINSAQEHITELAIQESNCKVYPINTLLLAMYGQGKTRGNVGLLKIEAATNQACAAILPSNSLNEIFTLNFFKNSYDFIRNLARGGNQENLNLAIVKAIEIIIPPLDLQNQFASIAQKIEKLKDEQAKQLLEMEALYASVSHAAFSGTLDLTRIPYDDSLLPVIETVNEPEVIDKKKEPEEIEVEIENKTILQLIGLNGKRTKDVSSSSNEWNKLSFQKIAELIKDHFQSNYFNSEMLLRFLTEDAKVKVDYFSSKEQKVNLKLENANDYLVFLTDAVTDKNPYLKLEQVFYNAEGENIKDISFTPQDLETLSKKTTKERSGIYFRIKNETTTR